MRVLTLMVLLLLGTSVQAGWLPPGKCPPVLERLQSAVEQYISGQGSFSARQALGEAGDALVQESRRLLDPETGEAWLLIRADESVSTMTTHERVEAGMTARVITLGLAASVLMTLVVVGFSLREFCREC